ncbi:uncharacterized protein ACNS7B_017969 isoform 2-T2 [Menidia menidia]
MLPLWALLVLHLSCGGFCTALPGMQILSVERERGGSVLLPCLGSAHSGQQGAVHWEVEGRDMAVLQGEEPRVMERFQGRVHLPTPEQVQAGYWSVILFHTEVSDSGMYQCIWDGGRAVSTVWLTVSDEEPRRRTTTDLTRKTQWPFWIVEGLDVERSTQTMTGSTQTMEGSTQTMEGSTQTMTGSTQTMEKSTQTMEGSTQTMEKSTQTMEKSTQTMTGSTQTMEGSTQTMEESTQTMEESTQTMTGSTQTMEESTQTMTGSTQTMEESTKAMEGTTQAKTGSTQPMKGLRPEPTLADLLMDTVPWTRVGLIGGVLLLTAVVVCVLGALRQI